MKYDVFLSHASKDKTEFVEELKKSFDKLGISVFYDTDAINWGDNWKQKILEGLKNCHFGVIVISKNFFDRTWTEKELKALLNRQNEEGEKIILPILYNVSIEEINKKYKKLSDIQFIDSSVLNVKDITICKEVLKKLNFNPNVKYGGVLEVVLSMVKDVMQEFYYGRGANYEIQNQN